MSVSGTMSLREVLRDAEARKAAVGHFNVSDLAALKAIVKAAREYAAPVIIGISEGEREFVGTREIAALVRSIRESYGLPVFLNADHTHSIEKAEEAVRAGFDEILFDASALPFEENLKQTKRAVAAIRAINPNALVEGELGYIGNASEILEQAPEGTALTPDLFTTAEEAARFVRETGIDVLAPAVGNMHGLLKEMVEGKVQKHIDATRLTEIKKAAKIFLTLHGGSGTADADLKAAIEAGINIVHINTELRLAWRHGVEEGLKMHPEEIAPYKILPQAVEKIYEAVKARLNIFGWNK